MKSIGIGASMRPNDWSAELIVPVGRSNSSQPGVDPDQQVGEERKGHDEQHEALAAVVQRLTQKAAG